MDRINQIVEMTGSSNHLPAVFSLLVGLFVFKKDSRLYIDDTEVPGDNIPTTLIEGIGR